MTTVAGSVVTGRPGGCWERAHITSKSTPSGTPSPRPHPILPKLFHSNTHINEPRGPFSFQPQTQRRKIRLLECKTNFLLAKTLRHLSAHYAQMPRRWFGIWTGTQVSRFRQDCGHRWWTRLGRFVLIKSPRKEEERRESEGAKTSVVGRRRASRGGWEESSVLIRTRTAWEPRSHIRRKRKCSWERLARESQTPEVSSTTSSHPESVIDWVMYSSRTPVLGEVRKGWETYIL